MDIEETNKTLEVIQKFLVIIGALFSAWYFLLKEESSPHVKLSLTTQAVGTCTIRIDVAAENKGSRPWEIKSGMAIVFKPNFNRHVKPEQLADLKVTDQMKSVNHWLRKGEISSFGFDLKVPKLEQPPEYYVIKVSANLSQETNEWTRIVEGMVNLPNC
ncbi:hypothetical protein P3531_17005 [Vibrio parahaemolyticus]|nr:hypothetical protein [Vibrio parahaemolyticus]MDG2604250.1 hypothetical protein [Vibrio parahaemolyticus]